jgi:hypothetical protein
VSDFNEEQHPRADDGKFGQGSGGTKARSPKAKETVAKGKSAAAQRAIDKGLTEYGLGNFAAAKATFDKVGYTPADHIAKRMADAGHAVAGKPAESAPAAKAPTAAAKGPAAPTLTDKAKQTVAKAKDIAKTKAAEAKTPSPPTAAPTAASPAPAPLAALMANRSPVPSTPARAASTGASPAHDVAVADSARRALISSPFVASADPRDSAPQWTSAAQRAIREHHDQVLATYGLHNRDASLIDGRKVGVGAKMMVGESQCYGMHSTGGEVTLWKGVADHLSEHAKLTGPQLMDVGQRALAGDKDAVRLMDSYRVSTHEALHGFGGYVMPASRNGTMFDEVSTELVARRVTADVHGIDPHRMQGSYDRWIQPTVGVVAEMSGKSHKEAFDALTAAAIAAKSKDPGIDKQTRAPPQLWGANVMEEMLQHSLSALGVRDAEQHKAAYDKIDAIDMDQRKYDKVYPSVNRYK